MVFNFFVFLFSGILFSGGIVNSSPVVYGYAFVGALFTVLFQLTYTEALSLGNVSLSVLIVNLGMVINVIFSYFVYKEPMSWFRVVGIVLTLIAFVCCTDFKNGKPTEKRWFIYTISAMFATTLASGVQQIFSKSQYSAQNGVYGADIQEKAVFVNGLGNPHTESSINKFWNRFLREYNEYYNTNAKFGMHQFRHTFCSMLYNSGVDIKTAQSVLGHADVSITLSVYTHLGENQKKHSIDKLNDYIKKNDM